MAAFFQYGFFELSLDLSLLLLSVDEFGVFIVLLLCLGEFVFD